MTRNGTELLSVADSNHVILRALKPVYERATRDKNLQLAAWAENSIADERKRIANMLEHMERVCNGLEAAECPTTVMKTLDHWPDIGNDIDLYSTAPDERIAEVMKREFNARSAAQLGRPPGAQVEFCHPRVERTG